jgi:hypothetical protein
MFCDMVCGAAGRVALRGKNVRERSERRKKVLARDQTTRTAVSDAIKVYAAIRWPPRRRELQWHTSAQASRQEGPNCQKKV